MKNLQTSAQIEQTNEILAFTGETNSIETVELKAGDTVFNTAFPNYARIGEVVDRDGVLKVSFQNNGKTYTTVLTDRWQILPSNAFVEKPQTENKKATSAKVEANTSETEKPVIPAILPDEVKPLNETEKAEQSALVTEYKRITKRTDAIDKKISELESELGNKSFQQYRIASKIRRENLWREFNGVFFTTFQDFAKEILEINSKQAQNWMQYGDFLEVTNYDNLADKDVKTNVNSLKRLVVNQNATAEKFGLKDAGLTEFKPFLDEVIETTIEVARNDKGAKVTERVVDATNEVITGFLDGQKLDFENIIANATAKLAANREQLVADSKAKLAEKVTLSECEHSLDIESVENNIVTLTCGCTFRRFKA